MPSDIQRLTFELSNRPQDFELSNSRCRLIHKPSKQHIWVASGRAYCKLYEPYEIKFTLIDKFRFWSVYKVWAKGLREAERKWLRGQLCEPQAPKLKAMAAANQ